MGKICAVKSCPSGRKLKSNPNSTPQSLSFFQPTTSARLESWKKSLGIDLRSTYYICHLHFKEEHIKMYEKFNINGEIKILPTGKKMLKEEAIPSIEHQFIPIQGEEFQASLINSLQKQSLSSDYSEDLEEDEECADSEHTELFVNQEMNSDVIVDYEQLDQSEEIQGASEKQPENQVISQSNCDILNDLTNLSILPPLWLYLVTGDDVEFMRMDSTTRNVTNHIRLNRNLSITVIFPNNDELNLNYKISSLHEITDYLKSVEKWPICVGTQIDGNSFAKQCKRVIIGEDTYKRAQQYPRCKFCRILRKRLLNYHSTLASENSIAHKRCAKEVIKQCKRLKKNECAHER